MKKKKSSNEIGNFNENIDFQIEINGKFERVTGIFITGNHINGVFLHYTKVSDPAAHVFKLPGDSESLKNIGEALIRKSKSK